MKILIADDQELVREAIAAFLRMEPDFTVDATSDFPSAVEAVKRNGTYDLVLLDYMMPGMNGLSGLAAMKKLQEGKPVAILSGTAPPCRSWISRPLRGTGAWRRRSWISSQDHVNAVLDRSGALHGGRRSLRAPGHDDRT